jgi:hypothetical protein
MARCSNLSPVDIIQAPEHLANDRLLVLLLLLFCTSGQVTISPMQITQHH